VLGHFGKPGRWSQRSDKHIKAAARPPHTMDAFSSEFMECFKYNGIFFWNQIVIFKYDNMATSATI
jgi:hypothetical protein